MSNRQAITKGAISHQLGQAVRGIEEPEAAAKVRLTADEIDEGLRAVVSALLEGEGVLKGEARALGGALASHLVRRMCVPRDMGKLSGLELRQLARCLGAEELGGGANSALRKWESRD